MAGVPVEPRTGGAVTSGAAVKGPELPAEPLPISTRGDDPQCPTVKPAAATQTPDDCPFHNLDPGATVWIDLDGMVLPYSGEVACDNYHLGVALRPVVDAAIARMVEETA
jgi:hypothetical protein